jgi:hypothetical protein
MNRTPAKLYQRGLYFYTSPSITLWLKLPSDQTARAELNSATALHNQQQYVRAGMMACLGVPGVLLGPIKSRASMVRTSCTGTSTGRKICTTLQCFVGTFLMIVEWVCVLAEKDHITPCSQCT